MRTTGEKSVVQNKSPLRYPGGKTRACTILYAIASRFFDLSSVDTLLSPFFGGGSFEFFLESKHPLSIFANDAFGPLIAFWTSCQTQNTELCDMLRETSTPSKEDFLAFQKSILAETNALRLAYLYFVVNRCSFSGSTLSGGYSSNAALQRFTKTSIDRVEALDLSHVSFSNKDYETFLEAHPDSSSSLLFVDPPYMLTNKSRLYGHRGGMHANFDHVRLQTVLKTRTRWILTYNDCEEIRNLYRDYVIVPVDWKYGMNVSKKSSELVILSCTVEDGSVSSCSMAPK